MRYRGPYEYDKFILNTMQYYNMANDFIQDLNSTSTWKTLKKKKKKVDNLFQNSTNTYGKSDEIYRLLIMNRGD